MRRKRQQESTPSRQVGISASPYLTLPEAAMLLRFDVTAPSNPNRACWMWLRRNAVPIRKRGRTILVERAVLERILEDG
jgi:hypothetical protein